MSDAVFILLYLAIALVVTAWAIHVKRDRKILFVIMGVSLLFLGIVKQGCTCSPGSIQNVVSALHQKHLHSKELKALERDIEQAQALGNTEKTQELLDEKRTLNQQKDSYMLPFAILGIFFLPVIASFFWGRVFCSGVCPLGIVQDILSVIRLNIPRWLRAILSVIPVIYLAYVIVAIVSGAGFVLCKYDPYVHLLRFNITPGFFWFTAISVVMTMVIYRPFCSFFCPYGLILGWVGKFSRNSIEPTPAKCVTCNLCADACPVDAIEYGDRKREEKSFRLGKIGILLLLLLPLWFFLFGASARAVSGRIAAVNSSIEQAEKKVSSLRETVSQRERSGKSVKKLREKLRKNEAVLSTHRASLSRVQVRSFYIGGSLGLYWGLLLLFLYERKIRQGIHVNMAKCVTCGRCNNYCPTESKADHAGITNFLVGHIKHRKEPHPKLKMAIVVLMALSLTTLLGSSVTLYQSMQQQQDFEARKQSYLKKYNAVYKKKSATPELKEEYAKEHAVLGEELQRFEGERSVSMVLLVVSLFLFAGTLKYFIGKKEYSEVVKELRKYRSKIHALNELLVFGGVVILGLLLFILVSLFL